MLQVSKLYSLKKVAVASRGVAWIKAAVFLALTFYVFYTLQEKGGYLHLLRVALLQGQMHYLPLAVIVLVPVNWSFEAWKWQFLLRKIEHVSFTEAFAGVLSGLSFGFVTPQSIGDFAGRVIRLKSSSKYQSLGALLISNFAQFYITLLGGSLSIAFLMFYQGWIGSVLITLLLVLLNTSLLMAFLNQKKALDLLLKRSKLQKLYKYVTIGGGYRPKEIAFALWLALLRYLTFSVQFVCMLYYFSVDLPLYFLFLGVSFVFLAKSVLPVLNSIGDLGIREATALFFFSLFGVEPEKVVIASLMIWLVNIVLPSVSGLGVVLATKIKGRCW